MSRRACDSGRPSIPPGRALPVFAFLAILASLAVLSVASAPISARAQIGPEEVDEGRCANAGTMWLCVDQKYPTQGKPCGIRVTKDDLPVERASVRVTYRPNSEVMDTQVIGKTDADGRIRWVPQEAGIATLQAEEAGVAAMHSGPGGLGRVELTVSIRFRTAPWLGVAILILAALILFGGNGYSFAKTFGKS